jgi:hypothetical protein
LADYLAAAVTDDPHWLDHSDQQDAAARALDQPHCSSPEMQQALPLSDANVPYNPYPLGSVLAEALWTTGQSTQSDLVAQGALAALGQLKTTVAASGGKLAIADALNAVAAGAIADELPVLCGMLLDRFSQFGLTASSLPACASINPVAPCNCNPNATGCTP